MSEPDPEPPTTASSVAATGSGGVGRLPLVVATLGALLAVVVVLLVLREGEPDPVEVAEPAGTSRLEDLSAEEACQSLGFRLPETLAGRSARDVVGSDGGSAPSGTAAWGDPPLVVTCGVDRPARLNAASEVVETGGVQVFVERRDDGGDRVTVVDRPVYVQLDAPPEISAGDAVQGLAEAVVGALPETPLDLPDAPATPDG